MSLVEEIYRQRNEFLVRNLTPTVVVAPYSRRHELLGEALDRFGPPNFLAGIRNLHILGLRVMFSHECENLQVLGGPR